MVIASGLFTAFTRLIGAVATRTVGWAVILLFGRVPQDRQALLSLVAFGSLAWLIAVLGVLVPAIGDLIVSAVPRPPIVPTEWLRWALIALAAFLPLAVGLATIALAPEEERTSPAFRARQILRGYPLTVVLAGTIVFLAAWGFVRRLRALRSGWESVHVAMIVKPGRYEAVVDDIESAIAAAGLKLDRSTASRWFIAPPRLLAAVGGRAVKGLVPDELAAFRGDALGILVYPSDVALVGRADLVARARGSIARQLAISDAYLTAGKESQQIEDRLRELSQKPSVQASDFEPIDEAIASLEVPYDEWETLYRLRLQVEHDCVGRQASRGGDRSRAA